MLKMKWLILIIFLILIPLSYAESTFFDNPDDVFVIGSSATSETTGGITGGATGDGGCVYKWNCTNWSECSPDGKQIRNCVNVGTCPDTYKSPSTEQNCNYAASLKSDEEDKELENGKESEKNLLWLFWIIIGIVIAGLILSQNIKNFGKRLKRKEEGIMLIDKNIIEILKENIQGKM